MDISVNSKRRMDSGDSLTEKGKKKHNQKPVQETQTCSQPQTLSLPQPKEKNDKIPSSTTATSSNYSSPTTTKKYPS